MWPIPSFCLLPVRMKVWDSTGGFYDGKLTAPVRLPKLAPFDIWTHDDNPGLTNDLTPQTASATIGGNMALHVR